MRVLVAGATGAIGRPLVDRLLAAGHEVAAITRGGPRDATLRAAGVEPHTVDVFDAGAVRAACLAARPDVVVVQLTALPSAVDMRRYARDVEPTNRLRREATPHLVAGARAAGAARVVVQSISFVTAPTGPAVHDEDAPVFHDAPPAFRGVVAATAGMERTVLAAEDLSPVVLRYGFFYGPGTFYAPDGAIVREIVRRRFPLVGGGAGTSSFVHVDDAAAATVLALDGGRPGVFNVTDDDPAPMRDWLPVAARTVGARPPLRVPAWVGRVAAGPHAVHFATTLRGNDNRRMKETFGWTPAWPSWREGFAAALT